MGRDVNEISIRLSWPPSALSGHAKGNWRSKSKVVKTFRDEACLASKKHRGAVLPDGDIRTRVTFFPPDRRSDRLNYPNRMKPYFDGIADALGVNDKRFCIPEYIVTEPSKDPHVLVDVLVTDEETLEFCRKLKRDSLLIEAADDRDLKRPDGAFETPARPTTEEPSKGGPDNGC